MAAHKIWSIIIVVFVIAIGYYWYRSASSESAVPQYQIARARTGNIVQTVTGTGQVSAGNQLDVASKVSGTIQSIKVSVGQHVKAGDLIAAIDPSDAVNSLESARLSYAKLTAPPKDTDLSNAQNSVVQSYNSGLNGISSLLLDLQTIMPGMNDLFYGQGQYLGVAESSSLISTAQAYRAQAGASLDKARAEYQSLLASYGGISRQSATTTIANALGDSYALAKDVANALQNTQNAITYIATYQADYHPNAAATTKSNVTAWSNTINADVASLLSARNGISSAENALTNLVSGADPLDVQSQLLSLHQAEQNYADYFIRAPFDGVVGRIPISVYGQASNGTIMATVIGDQKIATLSLNEVDAAKVKAGDPVTITFDAINDLTATGTVAEVDLVGTVSQGVVSYAVKVAIGTADSRILPGMSASATIITDEKDGVLVVPSSAVKTQGNRSYVQVFDNPALPTASSNAGNANGTGSSTRSGFNRGRFASSTATFASSTFSGTFNGRSATAGQSFSQNRSVTISSATAPRAVDVTTGASDDSNTEITGGLSGGEWVVTQTISSQGQTTAAPNILNALGGNRGGNATFRAAAAAGR